MNIKSALHYYFLQISCVPHISPLLVVPLLH